MWFPQGHLHIPQPYTMGLYQCYQVQPLAPAEQALLVPVSWWEWLMRAGWACSVQSRCGANLPWLSQLTLSENQNQQREYDNNVLQGPCFSLCLLSCWWNNSEFKAKNGAHPSLIMCEHLGPDSSHAWASAITLDNSCKTSYDHS